MKRDTTRILAQQVLFMKLTIPRRLVLNPTLCLALLCLGLAAQVLYARAGAAVLTFHAAARKKVTNMQILWQIDRLSEIGGHKPEVLGNPQVIEAPGNRALAFDGQDDGLILNTNPLSGARRFTVEVIFRPDPSANKAQRFLHMQASEESRVLVETRLNDTNEWFLDTFIKSGESEKTLQSRENLHPVGKWYHVALTYDGHWMRHYVNGTEERSGEVKYLPVAGGQTSIGCRLNQVFWFQGAIQTVRITHEAVSPAQFLQKPE